MIFQAIDSATGACLPLICYVGMPFMLSLIYVVRLTIVSINGLSVCLLFLYGFLLAFCAKVCPTSVNVLHRVQCIEKVPVEKTSREEQ